MKKLPLGIQNISEILQEDYIYIDKTKTILDLIKSGKYFFLSRPRRFGKSLLLSTLKEIFSGNKDLFEGLYIHDKIEWETHPVIHIDFSYIKYSKSIEVFEESLIFTLNETAEKYNVTLTANNITDCFRELIKKLYQNQNKVVVLIDEYDKPIIDFLADKKKAEENRNVLRDFYSILKGSDEYLKFVFLTGVSKFSKVSIFSGLNNILDITLLKDFSTILGITEDELGTYFEENIKDLSIQEEISQENLLQDIKYWYNGYSWDGINRVYNPTSLLHLFHTREFSNYWFSTGTPNFLIKTIAEYNYPITKIEEVKVGKTVIDSYDIDKIDISSLLLQTGYLTIKSVFRLGKERFYTLKYPNHEVKDSLLNYIISDFTGEPVSEIKPQYLLMVQALMNRELDTFINIIKAMFARIPYNLYPKNDSSNLSKLEDKTNFYHEAYYHSLFYLMLSLLGVEINLEVLTDKGRMDGVLELDDAVYIIELKRGTPQDAINQIDEKRYYEPYLSSGKDIFLLGIGGFDTKDIGYICKQIEMK